MNERDLAALLELANKVPGLKERLDVANQRWRALDQERHEVRAILGAAPTETLKQAAERVEQACSQRVRDLETERSVHQYNRGLLAQCNDEHNALVVERDALRHRFDAVRHIVEHGDDLQPQVHKLKLDLAIEDARAASDGELTTIATATVHLADRVAHLEHLLLMVGRSARGEQ